MTDFRMLMVAPAPVIRKGDNFFLDVKFAEGMICQSKFWGGQFDCILRLSSKDIPFGTRRYDHTLGFGLRPLPADQTLTPDDFRGYDIAFCSADDPCNFYLADVAAAGGCRLATTLEYTLDARLEILRLDTEISALRRVVRKMKLRREEKLRQAFLARMDALQANGYPALEICRKHDPNALLFLDSRMTTDIFATDEEMAERERQLLSGAPLRLVFSGRLEPLKGAQDLIPVTLELRRIGVEFRLDIFGSGSLAPAIRKEIDAADLSNVVTLHDPVDFATSLVPYLRTSCDIYLCCHRQSDPSCSYLESMGCGLAVTGYDNAMWRVLQRESGAGWSSPIGKPEELARCIAEIDANRIEIVERCSHAREFARIHDFETESRRRMEHLLRLVQST